MKKEYTLDYTIERDIDRMHAIEQILDQMEKQPNQSDLELFASYILYGKDENGKNSIERRETYDSNTKRYKSFQTLNDKIISLEAYLDNPMVDQSMIQPVDTKRIYLKKQTKIEMPRHDAEGNIIDIGDGDIPGMQQLWDDIARLTHTLNANEGKTDFNPNDTVFTDPYRLWQFKHLLIDVKKHQYYLKDAYKPTVEFCALSFPKPQTIDWSNDSFYWISREQLEEKLAHNYDPQISQNICDYETRENPYTHELEYKWVVRVHTFNWENTWHIRQLITHYSALYEQTWDNVNSWGRTLIFDFDRYFNLCDFSPLREFVLIRRIDGLSPAKIAEEVHEKFGIKYSGGAIAQMLTKEIPEKIAQQALRDRLLKETPTTERKRCARCGRLLPRTLLFFAKNKGKLYGLSSSCKECEKQMRIARGQSAHDKRNKDTTMYQV